ncbi:MAG: HNH endonuclease [Bermanella sp.]
MKPCNHPGCGKLIEPTVTHCVKHKQIVNKQREVGRKNSYQRGYTGQWRKARLGFLAKHPLCNRCIDDNITEEATVVDHIIPHRGNNDVFWDRLNWQPLCKRCHDRKTATEDGGFTGYDNGQVINGECSHVTEKYISGGE